MASGLKIISEPLRTLVLFALLLAAFGASGQAAALRELDVAAVSVEASSRHLPQSGQREVGRPSDARCAVSRKPGKVVHASKGPLPPAGGDAPTDFVVAGSAAVFPLPSWHRPSRLASHQTPKALCNNRFLSRAPPAVPAR